MLYVWITLQQTNPFPVGSRGVYTNEHSIIYMYIASYRIKCNWPQQLDCVYLCIYCVSVCVCCLAEKRYRFNCASFYHCMWHSYKSYKTCHNWHNLINANLAQFAHNLWIMMLLWLILSISLLLLFFNVNNNWISVALVMCTNYFHGAQQHWTLRFDISNILLLLKMIASWFEYK